MRVINPPRRYVGRPSARELSKNWCRPQALPANWSCDWENWDGILDFFIHPAWYNLSDADLVLRSLYNISGAVEPLAFYPHFTGDGNTFLFAAAGDYYYINMRYTHTRLYRYESQFASHSDFLARVEAAPRALIPQMEGREDQLYSIMEAQRMLRTADWVRS